MINNTFTLTQASTRYAKRLRGHIYINDLTAKYLHLPEYDTTYYFLIYEIYKEYFFVFYILTYLFFNCIFLYYLDYNYLKKKQHIVF